MVPTRMTHGHADQYTGVGVAIGATMDGRHTTARSNTRRVRHPPLAGVVVVGPLGVAMLASVPMCTGLSSPGRRVEPVHRSSDSPVASRWPS